MLPVFLVNKDMHNESLLLIMNAAHGVSTYLNRVPFVRVVDTMATR